MSLIMMLVVIIFWLCVAGLAYWLISLIGLTDPFPRIIRVLFIIIAVLIVLVGFGLFGGGLGLPHFR